MGVGQVLARCTAVHKLLGGDLPVFGLMAFAEIRFIVVQL